MILSYVVYVLCIGLLIWGGKFAGFKSNQFHDNSTSLEVTKSLRGFAAVGVILHHISQEGAFQWAGGYGKPGELSIFVNAGYLFVAIFFFCSGFGLIKSLEQKPDYLKTFLKKRVLKGLVIPYYVSVVIYSILRFANGERFPFAQWITNILGLSMVNVYAWYPVVACILYLAFYFIFKNIKNEKVCFTLMGVVILLLGVIFSFNGHFAWWAGPNNWWLDDASPVAQKWWTAQKLWWLSGEWWVNSAPALFIGMLFARFENQIRKFFAKKYWLKFAGVVLIMFILWIVSSLAQAKLGFWTEYNGNGPEIWKKFVTYLGQIPEAMWFAVLIFVIMLKYYASNPVTRFFGKISLETYMMNLIALNIFQFLLYKPDAQYGWVPDYKPYHYNLAIYFACVFAATILLGLIYKWICSFFQKIVRG